MRSTPVRLILTRSSFHEINFHEINFHKINFHKITVDHIYGGALISSPLSHSLNGKLSGGLSWVGWVVMLLPYNHTPFL